VACQRTFKLERLRLRRFIARTWDHLFEILDFPDLRGVVGAAGSKMLDVWGKEDSSNILPVSFKVGDWYQRGLLPV
jgi:hypothetical protein